MATPIIITNWGHQVTPDSAGAQGGGLYSAITGTGLSIDTSIYRNSFSPQSLKVNVSSASSFITYTQVNG